MVVLNFTPWIWSDILGNLVLRFLHSRYLEFCPKHFQPGALFCFCSILPEGVDVVLETFHINFNFLKFLVTRPPGRRWTALSTGKTISYCFISWSAVERIREYRQENVKLWTFLNRTQVSEVQSAIFLAAFQSTYTSMSQINKKCTLFTLC